MSEKRWNVSEFFGLSFLQPFFSKKVSSVGGDGWWGEISNQVHWKLFTSNSSAVAKIGSTCSDGRMRQRVVWGKLEVDFTHFCLHFHFRVEATDDSCLQSQGWNYILISNYSSNGANRHRGSRWRFWRRRRFSRGRWCKRNNKIILLVDANLLIISHVHRMEKCIKIRETSHHMTVPETKNKQLY